MKVLSWGKKLCGVFTAMVMHTALADNLGHYGHTYPIVETDFLVFIEDRLQTLSQDGTLKRMQQDWQETVVQSAERPTPVQLTTCDETKTHHYDPTFVASRDLVNMSGHIVVRKGDSVNPLKAFPLLLFQRVLIFYNDDDKKQRAFVARYLKTHPATSRDMGIKVILIQGNVKKAAKALGGNPVYFDQHGKITTQWGIQHVPAIVTRDNDTLLVTEVGKKECEHE